MRLAIPGKIISVKDGELFARLGRVEFDGIIKEVNLYCVPEADVGDYVIVHVGFAISKVDPNEAKITRDYLKQMKQILDCGF
ncbi:MAG: HypC/HybG/HupF family hydrogenase formation chaperone [Planctomycetota bacterium]